MHSRTLLAAALTPFAFIGPVMAGEAADMGPYLAGGLSRASFNGSDFDDSDQAATIRLGYMVNGFFGVEAGYHDLGGFTDDVDALEDLFSGLEGLGIDVGVDLNGYSAGAVLNWPLKLFDIYGKAGALAVEAKLAVDTPLGRITESDTDAEPFLTFGGEIDFGRFNLFGELTRIQLDRPGFEDLDIATFGLKLEF